MHRYAIVFDTKEEFDEAEALLAGSRRSPRRPSPASAQAEIVQKLEAALASAPLNPQKQTVLKAWLAAPADDWVPYADVVQAFIDAGIGDSAVQATNRASAAIRDLSFQVSQTLLPSDLAGFDKAIEALASRSRSAGVFSHRLTPEGRIATQQFLNKIGVA